MIIVQYTKRFIKFLLAILYAAVLIFSSKKGHKIIVFYHGVTAKENKGFQKQLSFIADHYRVLSVSELLSKEQRDGENLCAITFDDAFENLLENALPFLKDKKMPATIFVPAGNIGRTPGWDIGSECMDKSENIMTMDQLKTTREAGFDLQSHTMTHPRLAECNDNKLRTELFESKAQLENLLNNRVSMISYPHGSCSETVFSVARNAGYDFGFTIRPETVKKECNPLAIPRVGVSPLDGMIVLSLKLMGAYGYTQLKR